MKRVFFILALFFSFEEARAFENQMMIKFGLPITSSDGLPADGSSTHSLIGVGISPKFGYRFVDYEIGVSSQISIGYFRDFSLDVDGNQLTGEGYFSSQHFTFYLKRFAWDTDLFNEQWRWFFHTGPSAIFNAFRFDEFDSSDGDFSKDNKITSVALGGEIAIGLEEMLGEKEDHPAYIQLSYSLHNPKKFNVIDASDRTEVESVFKNTEGFKGTVQTIVLEIGMTIF